MAVRIRRADHVVIVLGFGVVGPQITRPNRHGPIGWLGNPVRAVEHADKTVDAAWRGPVTLRLAGRNTAFADGTGVRIPLKPQPRRGQNQIVACHSRCPDLAALVAR